MDYNDFTERAIHVIKSIPEGKVLTYGLIAEMAGNARGARQVSRILHSMTEKHNLPWYRVINLKGTISIKETEGKYYQKHLLEQEGVQVSDNYEIDINEYLWRVEPGEL
ncbi:MGMT family protein [Chloroflexota bacterium]